MNRIDWIDELKGFLLILVCLAHANVKIPFWGGDFLIVCKTFRMVSFFFLSGMLFSNRHHLTIISYTSSKAKSLLMPYLYLSLLFIFLDPRLYDMTLDRSYLTDEPIHTTFDFLCFELKEIFWYGNSVPVTATLWFVWVLFAVSTSFFIMHHLSHGNKATLCIYAIVCLAAGWLCNLHELTLPFRLSTIFTATFFFYFGYFTKQYVTYLTAFPKTLLCIMIILLFGTYLYFVNKNGSIGLHHNSLGKNFYAYISSSITGIFFIICVFILWSKIDIGRSIKGILRNIARNALIILAVHYWVIIICLICLSQYTEKEYFQWLVTFIMILVTGLAIPLFRNKLYRLIGKEKITVKESLSIR